MLICPMDVQGCMEAIEKDRKGVKWIFVSAGPNLTPRADPILTP
jgi:hypothetical protein